MESQTVTHPFIDISSLPDISREEMDFLDTSFFKSAQDGSPRPELPSPAEISQKYPEYTRGARGVAIFEDLGLVIKAGPSDYLRLEEAQTIWAIRQAFPDGEVPVPELFGWRKVGEQVFIYMSLIPGELLRDAWKTFTAVDKSSVCKQLAQVIAALRRLKQKGQSPLDHYIGTYLDFDHIQLTLGS
jgi:hypothetical protein